MPIRERVQRNEPPTRTAPRPHSHRLDLVFKPLQAENTGRRAAPGLKRSAVGNSYVINASTVTAFGPARAFGEWAARVLAFASWRRSWLFGSLCRGLFAERRRSAKVFPGSDSETSRSTKRIIVRDKPARSARAVIDSERFSRSSRKMRATWGQTWSISPDNTSHQY